VAAIRLGRDRHIADRCLPTRADRPDRYEGRPPQQHGGHFSQTPGGGGGSRSRVAPVETGPAGGEGRTMTERCSAQEQAGRLALWRPLAGAATALAASGSAWPSCATCLQQDEDLRPPRSAKPRRDGDLEEAARPAIRPAAWRAANAATPRRTSFSRPAGRRKRLAACEQVEDRRHRRMCVGPLESGIPMARGCWSGRSARKLLSSKTGWRAGHPASPRRWRGGRHPIRRARAGMQDPRTAGGVPFLFSAPTGVGKGTELVQALRRAVR